MFTINRFLAAGLCLAAAAASQTHSGNLDLRFQRGPSQLCAVYDVEADHYGIASGWVTTGTLQRRGQFSAKGRAQFFGRSERLAEIRTKAWIFRDEGTRKGDAYAYGILFDRSIFNERLGARSSRGTLGTLEHELRLDLVSMDQNFLVGPIPVNVSLDLGSELDVGLGITVDPPRSLVSYGGYADAIIGRVEGSAGVGLESSAVGASAGVFGRVDLGNVKVVAGIVLEPASHGFGLTAVMQAVRVRLGAYAQAFVRVGLVLVRARYEKVIFDWASDSVTRRYRL